MTFCCDRVPKSDLGTKCTHLGRFYGIVPVYLGDPLGPAPTVAVRNGWPDWLLDVADWIWNAAVWACQLVNPAFEHPGFRSEEHTSELQSLMRISYAVFFLKKKQNSSIKYNIHQQQHTHICK